MGPFNLLLAARQVQAHCLQDLCIIGTCFYRSSSSRRRRRGRRSRSSNCRAWPISRQATASGLPVSRLVVSSWVLCSSQRGVCAQGLFYRVCSFGDSFSAHWCHHMVCVSHILLAYVDDRQKFLSSCSMRFRQSSANFCSRKHLEKLVSILHWVLKVLRMASCLRPWLCTLAPCATMRAARWAPIFFPTCLKKIA